jgi:hypothetical protein
MPNVTNCSVTGSALKKLLDLAIIVGNSEDKMEIVIVYKNMHILCYILTYMDRSCHKQN